MDKRLVKIGSAAALLGTTPDMLRRWEKSGELLPARKTRGGTRYYAVADLLGISNEAAPTIGYARVSSPDQKADLERQHAMLEAYCAAKGWQTEIVKGPRLWHELPQERSATPTGDDLAAADQAPGVDAQGSPVALRPPSWSLRCARYRALRSSSSTKANSRALRQNWRRTSWRSSPCSAPGFMALVSTSTNRLPAPSERPRHDSHPQDRA